MIVVDWKGQKFKISFLVFKYEKNFFETTLPKVFIRTIRKSICHPNVASAPNLVKKTWDVACDFQTISDSSIQYARF